LTRGEFATILFGSDHVVAAGKFAAYATERTKTFSKFFALQAIEIARNAEIWIWKNLAERFSRR